jgi:hypothetical protein
VGTTTSFAFNPSQPINTEQALASTESPENADSAFSKKFSPCLFLIGSKLKTSPFSQIIFNDRLRQKRQSIVLYHLRNEPKLVTLLDANAVFAFTVSGTGLDSFAYWLTTKML